MSTGSATASKAETGEKMIEKKLPDGRVVQVTDYRVTLFSRGRKKDRTKIWSVSNRFALSQVAHVQVDNDCIGLLGRDYVYLVQLSTSDGVAC